MGDLNRYFSAHEYFDRREYDLFKKGKLPIRILDPKLLEGDMMLRERYGSITINDWFWGGQYHESGFRAYDCPTGAKYSDHRFGKASDKKFNNVTLEEVWKDIQDHESLFRNMNFYTVEKKSLTPTWFHSSVGRYAGQSKIHFVGL